MKDLLTSRKFWFTLFLLIAVVVTAILPTVGVNIEAKAEDLGGAAVLIVTLVIGIAIDAGQGWGGMLKSRKFWSAVVGFLVIAIDIFGKQLPFDLSPEQLITICTTLGGYIVAVALEDKKVIFGPLLGSNILSSTESTNEDARQ